MRVLVMGAGGMAGHVVARYLMEHFVEVDTLSKQRNFDAATHFIDVTAPDKLVSFLRGNRYDAVVNCIGVLVGESGTRKDLATYLNSYLPHLLEQHYAGTDTRVIHISTDCVFSGLSAPYREDSVPDGRHFYDLSKSLGELLNGKDLTLRMSIVGPDQNKTGSGLFNWFMQQEGEVSGFASAMWSGITTLELAKGIHAALDDGLAGLYHLVPSTNISKFDLLRLFQKVFELRQIVVVPQDYPRVDKTLVNTRTDFGFVVPDYEPMVVGMREWVDRNRSLYTHYPWVDRGNG